MEINGGRNEVKYMPMFMDDGSYQLSGVPDYAVPELDDDQIAEEVEREIAHLENLRESCLENGQFDRVEELAIKIAELEDYLPDC